NAPELFDPSTGTFTRLTTEVTTPPYERTEHAAHAVEVDGRTFVYLIGGRGRISLTGTTLGTRSDFRIGELVPAGDGETLRNTLAIGPDLARSPQAVSSFTFTPTGPLDGQGFGDFILAGTYTRELDVQLVEPVALAVTLAQDPSYDDVPVSPMTTDRSGHAAALIEPGLVLAAGGQVLGTGAPIPEAEVFAAEAQQFFPFPLKNGAPRLLIGRYGHTATKLDDGRILFLGGFNADGTATALAEFFELP
ncbi:MAG: kelch repeat-containing protein, partial [Bacteroidota bacterium]